jgi:hypothetical protein
MSSYCTYVGMDSANVTYAIHQGFDDPGPSD